jgi:hypothetical protein
MHLNELRWMHCSDLHYAAACEAQEAQHAYVNSEE